MVKGQLHVTWLRSNGTLFEHTNTAVTVKEYAPVLATRPAEAAMPTAHLAGHVLEEAC